MTLRERIRFDVASIEHYFRALFRLLEETTARWPVWLPDGPSRYATHDFRSFIKPDMLNNIHSLLEFWLSELCDIHRRRLALPLGYRDIRGTNDLDARHKYLTHAAGLDLHEVEEDLHHLHLLRKIR